MVKKVGGKFKCKECGLVYLEEQIAIRCEKFCKKNHGCDLDLIKHAVNERKDS
jgi:hypothetical protein